MATIAWPASRLFAPAATEWGETRIVRRSGGGTLGPSVQTVETPYSHRWTCTLTLRRARSFAERAQQEALLSQINQGSNRASLYHFALPAPAGTMRGSPTVSGAHSQGATTLSIATTTGNTLVAGDMLGVTTSIGQQLVRVVTGGTAAAGVLSVAIAPALRGSVTSGSAVVWDRPTALFVLDSPSWSSSYVPGEAQPLTVGFLEVLA